MGRRTLIIEKGIRRNSLGIGDFLLVPCPSGGVRIANMFLIVSQQGHFMFLAHRLHSKTGSLFILMEFQLGLIPIRTRADQLAGSLSELKWLCLTNLVVGLLAIPS